MVEKRQPGSDVRFTLTIKVRADVNIGFVGFPVVFTNTFTQFQKLIDGLPVRRLQRHNGIIDFMSLSRTKRVVIAEPYGPGTEVLGKFNIVNAIADDERMGEVIYR